jgi:hypothetical protein
VPRFRTPSRARGADPSGGGRRTQAARRAPRPAGAEIGMPSRSQGAVADGAGGWAAGSSSTATSRSRVEPARSSATSSASVAGTARSLITELREHDRLAGVDELTSPEQAWRLARGRPPVLARVVGAGRAIDHRLSRVPPRGRGRCGGAAAIGTGTGAGAGAVVRVVVVRVLVPVREPMTRWWARGKAHRAEGATGWRGWAARAVVRWRRDHDDEDGATPRRDRRVPGNRRRARAATQAQWHTTIRDHEHHPPGLNTFSAVAAIPRVGPAEWIVHGAAPPPPRGQLAESQNSSPESA